VVARRYLRQLQTKGLLNLTSFIWAQQAYPKLFDFAVGVNQHGLWRHIHFVRSIDALKHRFPVRHIAVAKAAARGENEENYF